MALDDKQGTTENEEEASSSSRRKKKRRRWGDAAAPATTTTSATPAGTAAAVTAAAATTMDPQAKILAMQANIRNKLAAARLAAANGSTAAAAVAVPPTTAASAAAASLSIKERLAAAKAKQIASTAIASSSSSSLKRPPDEAATAAEQKQAKRAKHYELDMSVTGPTFTKASAAQADKKKPNKKKKNINPYLAHHDEEDQDNQQDEQEELFVDDRLQRSSKPRDRKKEIRFVEPGKWQEIAERKREKVANAQESGFLSGRKAGHSIQSTAMGDIYGASGVEEGDDVLADYSVATLPPRYDAHPDTKMPLVMEWWDMELLPSRLKKQVAAAESREISNQSKAALQALEQKDESKMEEQDDDDPAAKQKAMEELQRSCFEKAALSYSKTAELVQHIVPIKPPNADTGPQKEPVLHLTKKELKRQRKLRRQEKQRELQDLQAAGLIPAPEPRLTLQNFIRVLGDQAYLDPSQMEKKVMEQVQARQQAHMDRNEASKLTKEQRAAKRARKLQEDTSQGVAVAIFLVKDMSHPYHRAKVDLNAQQLSITGGVLECQRPALSCVICEGGPKAIKRYIRLMTVRMKWTGPDDAEEQEDEDDDDNEDDEQATSTPKFNPENKCELVWQGMLVKRLFNSFLFQSCETSDQARKVLKAKGVAHFWDQVLQRASGQGDKLQLKLADDSDSDDNPYNDRDDDEDIVMKEE